MQEPYGEGLASHTDPESCVVAREGKGEALTGAHAGRAAKPCQLRSADVARSGNFDHFFPEILTTSTPIARGWSPRGIYRIDANPEG